MLNPQLLSALQQLLGEAQVRIDPADCHSYSYDNSRLSVLPEAVLFPTDRTAIAEIVTLCNRYQTPLTTRGRGSGTAGAAVPNRSGVVLSTEKLTQILRIDPANRLMVVEPGVTNQAVQQAAAKHGFFWAPDPSSAPFCSVGGNISCGTAGPHAVKYGTVRENILGLRAVTGSGETITTGTETTKWAIGYDLTQLLTGSEGTLAIITEATLKLLPLQPERILMRALYQNMQAAADAVAAIMAQPTTPAALEFMDGASLNLIRSRLGEDFPEDAHAMLMIEVDGSAETITSAVNAIQQAAQHSALIEIQQAASAEEQKAIWHARKILSPRLREIAPKKINEDIVVPVSSIPTLIQKIEELAAEYQIQIANFGHAGNGNLHTNLLVNPDDPEEMVRAELCLDVLFETVLTLRGSISGEHGIGLVKQPYVARQIGSVERRLMHQIKQQFDPNGILNPDKGPQPDPVGEPT